MSREAGAALARGAPRVASAASTTMKGESRVKSLRVRFKVASIGPHGAAALILRSRVLLPLLDEGDDSARWSKWRLRLPSRMSAYVRRALQSRNSGRTDAFWRERGRTIALQRARRGQAAVRRTKPIQNIAGPGKPLQARYTAGMKIAVSIPDDLHMEADRLARSLKYSRSRLYADAVRECLARHDPDAITSALNLVCDRLGADADPGIAAAGADLLRRVEW